MQHCGRELAVTLLQELAQELCQDDAADKLECILGLPVAFIS